MTQNNISPREALRIYNILKNKWGKWEDGFSYKLNTCRCFWMPKLEKGFVRLTFEEFLKMYNLNLVEEVI